MWKQVTGRVKRSMGNGTRGQFKKRIGPSSLKEEWEIIISVKRTLESGTGCVKVECGEQ